MSAYKLSDLAREDLRQLWDYINERSGADAADRVLNEIFDAIDMIVGYPHVGHVRTDLADPALRVWSVFSFLIIYWPDDSPLGIARVIEGHRELAGLSMPRL